MIDKRLEDAVANRIDELSRDVPDIDAMKKRIRESLVVETEQSANGPFLSPRLWLTAAAALVVCGGLVLAALASRQGGEGLIVAGPGDSTLRDPADPVVYPAVRFGNLRDSASQDEIPQSLRVFRVSATSDEVIDTLTGSLFDVDVTAVEAATFAGLKTTLVSMETRGGTSLVGFTLAGGVTLTAQNVDRSFRVYLVPTDEGVVALWIDAPRTEIEAAVGAAEIEVEAAVLGD